ncbi:MAG: hypothetical protein JJ975_00875 [Bacteroidia bacterium]|nr:hypothetical protein [Bacteroidia bacterium]
MGCDVDDQSEVACDEESLMTLESLYDQARLYNDSIELCQDPFQFCGQNWMDYYDSMYHIHQDSWKHHFDSIWGDRHETHAYDNTNGGSHHHKDHWCEEELSHHHEVMDELRGSHDSIQH